MWPDPQKPADLVKFTEEILNGKLQGTLSYTRLTEWTRKNKNSNLLKKFT